jgi:hypothetical protein
MGLLSLRNSGKTQVAIAENCSNSIFYSPFKRKDTNTLSDQNFLKKQSLED